MFSYTPGLHSPVIIFEARPPVRSPKQCLNCAGQVNKHVAHQEKPAVTVRKKKRQELKSEKQSPKNLKFRVVEIEEKHLRFMFKKVTH